MPISFVTLVARFLKRFDGSFLAQRPARACDFVSVKERNAGIQPASDGNRSRRQVALQLDIGYAS
jgi:hypothetical protein